MTLKQIIAARIAATGPMTLSDYMADCLLHPTLGYYTTRDPFGAAGDFTTAPEISQMFGEMLGLALAQTWLDQGAPPRVVLAELGPGRGTMMADVLRATRTVPGFHAALQICLVEASPVLRDLQAQVLAGQTVEWFRSVHELPDGPLYLLANEFFDALPIRQFQCDQAGWRERMVGLQGGNLGFGLGPVVTLQTAAKAGVTEVCPAASAVVVEVSRRIALKGGVALIIDYGDWGSQGDTFQALKSNAFADPFAEPGQADLTAHVDFAALAAVSMVPHAFVTQGQFLSRLGIGARAEQLAKGLTGAKLQSHLAAARRLTDDAEMGRLFKVLLLYPDNYPSPPGSL